MKLQGPEKMIDYRTKYSGTSGMSSRGNYGDNDSDSRSMSVYETPSRLPPTSRLANVSPLRTPRSRSRDRERDNRLVISPPTKKTRLRGP